MTAGAAVLAGLSLGLAAGATCFWTCASVMAPYLVSTGEDPADSPRWSTLPRSLGTLGWYHAGRLLAYLAAGVLVAGLTTAGATLPEPLSRGARILAALTLAAALLYTRKRGEAHRCPGTKPRAGGALTLGLLQGLSPCPPFLTALGLALASASPLNAILLFAALFAGTAILTLPLAFIEPLRRNPTLTRATRAAGYATCAYLLATALI